MKKLLWICLLFFHIYGLLGNPVLFLEMQDIDLGEIVQNQEPIQITMEFTNQGNEPLEIKEIHTSHESYTFRWYPDFVLPDKSNTLTILFDPALRLGVFSDTIYVASNASDIPEQIVINGSVITPEEEEKALKQIVEYQYMLGDISIDAGTREISFPAEVNMDEGIIELILTTDYGKLHESIFKTSIKPSHLQVALLLMGYSINVTDNPESDNSLLDIFVEWSDTEGKYHFERIERFAYNVIVDNEMEYTSWNFIGSDFYDNRFIADTEGSLISTYSSINAIIENPLDTNDNDEYYTVNKYTVPPKETKVKIYIKEIRREK